MKFPHIGLMTIIILAVGYVLGRYFPQPAMLVGLK
jgi:hypothetical protein